MPHLNINELQLRPLTMADLNHVWLWSRDVKFCAANDWELNRDAEEIRQWWDQCVNRLPKDFLRLGIEYGGRLIGYADLAYISGGSAEFGIAIGESALWGKGIGAKVAVSLLTYASDWLGITHFRAEAEDTNIRSRKMLKKIGFIETGTRQLSENNDKRVFQYELTFENNTRAESAYD